MSPVLMKGQFDFMSEQIAKKSSFQFTNPVVSRFDFHLNKNYEAADRNVALKLTMKVNTDDEGEAQKHVELNMSIGDEDSPFTISAIIGASFRWDPSLDKETVENLIQKNAVSLLIGYLRPIISQFTVQAGIEPFNLPFINLE